MKISSFYALLITAFCVMYTESALCGPGEFNRNVGSINKNLKFTAKTVDLMLPEIFGIENDIKVLHFFAEAIASDVAAMQRLVAEMRADVDAMQKDVDAMLALVS